MNVNRAKSLWATLLCKLATSGLAGLIMLAMLSVCPRRSEGTEIFKQDDENGFLRIESVPDGSPTIYTMEEVQTAFGKRRVCVVQGDCDALLWGIFRLDEEPGPARLVVESKSTRSYRVSFTFDGHAFAIAQAISKQLGVTLEKTRRTVPAFAIRAKIACEPTRLSVWSSSPASRPNNVQLNCNSSPPLKLGQLVPRVITRFPGGGMLICREKFDDDDQVASDNQWYFCSASYDDLARFLEHNLRFPVKNVTGDIQRHNFALRDDVCRSLDTRGIVSLSDAGISICWDRIPIDVVVARDTK